MPQGPVPSCWDDDDWEISVNDSLICSSDAYIPASETAAPPAIILSQSQPRTLYKPELKILKRATNNPSPTGNRSSTPSASSSSVEAQRKERERRYQEAKDRIFAESSTAATTNGSYLGGKHQQQQQKKKQGKTGGGICDKMGQISSNNSSRRPSPTQTVAAEKPSKPPTPPLIGTGTITSFSRNSATIIAGPIKTREREEWQLRQIAIDGKMLESQAAACGYGGVHDDELLGDKEKGLDWDEFRRDKWDGNGNGVELDSAELKGKLERFQVADKASIDRGKKNGGISQSHAVQNTIMRLPKGPDADAGKGFNGRGRGGRRRDGSGS